MFGGLVLFVCGLVGLGYLASKSRVVYPKVRTGESQATLYNV